MQPIDYWIAILHTCICTIHYLEKTFLLALNLSIVFSSSPIETWKEKEPFSRQNQPLFTKKLWPILLLISRFANGCLTRLPLQNGIFKHFLFRCFRQSFKSVPLLSWNRPNKSVPVTKAFSRPLIRLCGYPCAGSLKSPQSLKVYFSLPKLGPAFRSINVEPWVTKLCHLSHVGHHYINCGRACIISSRHDGSRQQWATAS